MTLTTKKSITLTGEVKIENTVVIYMSANILRENVCNASVTQSIVEPELYSKNSRKCREAISAFQTEVWEIEDSLMGEE